MEIEDSAPPYRGFLRSSTYPALSRRFVRGGGVIARAVGWSALVAIAASAGYNLTQRVVEPSSALADNAKNTSASHQPPVRVASLGASERRLNLQAERSRDAAPSARAVEELTDHRPAPAADNGSAKKRMTGAVPSPELPLQPAYHPPAASRDGHAAATAALAAPHEDVIDVDDMKDTQDIDDIDDPLAGLAGVGIDRRDGIGLTPFDKSDTAAVQGIADAPPGAARLEGVVDGVSGARPVSRERGLGWSVGAMRRSPASDSAESAGTDAEPMVAPRRSAPTSRSQNVVAVQQAAVRSSTSDELTLGAESTAKIAALDVRGPLSTAHVRHRVERIRGTLSECYQGAAQRAGRNVVSRARVLLTIDETGRVKKSPKVDGTSLPGLGDCLSSAFSKIVCRAPDTGVAKASVTLRFAP